MKILKRSATLVALVLLAILLAGCPDVKNQKGGPAAGKAPNIVLQIDTSANPHLPRWQCVLFAKRGVNFEFEPVDCSAPPGEIKKDHQVDPERYKAKCDKPQNKPCDQFSVDVKVTGSGHTSKDHTLTLRVNDQNGDGKVDEGDFNTNGLPLDVNLDTKSHPADTSHSGTGSHGGSAHAKY